MVSEAKDFQDTVCSYVRVWLFLIPPVFLCDLVVGKMEAFNAVQVPGYAVLGLGQVLGLVLQRTPLSEELRRAQFLLHTAS